MEWLNFARRVDVLLNKLDHSRSISMRELSPPGFYPHTQWCGKKEGWYLIKVSYHAIKTEIVFGKVFNGKFSLNALHLAMTLKIPWSLEL